jgi:hypothetical protein
VLTVCSLHRVEMEKDGNRWVCPEPGCDVVAWNGSSPADKATREQRKKAHLLLSNLWKFGQSTEEEVKRKLAKFMDLPVAECSVGHLDFGQCVKVQEFVESVLPVSVNLFGSEKPMSITNPPATGMLAKIQPSRKVRPPRILLLGTEKVGKSTFASEMANPVFLPVSKEEGIDDVDASTFPICNSFEMAMEAVQSLKEEHSFKTFVIDSVSTLSPLVIDSAMRDERVGSEAQLGGGFGHQYDTPLKKWFQLMGELDALRARGMTSILIGHVKAKRFEDPINGGYTRYDLDLPEKISQAIYRWVDVILFANWETYRVTESSGFGKETQRGSGTGNRVLYTQRRPSHPGGGRGVYGRLPYELPFDVASFRAAVNEQLALEKAGKAAE